MSTTKKSSSSIAKTHANTALAILIKELVKNVLYTIKHAKIELSRYSFKTLIFVKAVNEEGSEARTLKTYFFTTADKKAHRRL